MRAIGTIRTITTIFCAALATAVTAQKPFAEVGKQEPITILAPSTP